MAHLAQCMRPRSTDPDTTLGQCCPAAVRAKKLQGLVSGKQGEALQSLQPDQLQPDRLQSRQPTKHLVAHPAQCVHPSP